MDDIYYLVHATTHYNTKWKNLKTSSVSDYEHQFPGVYFSLITKDNIDKEELYPDTTQFLIFSKRLLEQKNYHINLKDYNGYISEKNTYYPWNLSEVVKKIKDQNETSSHNEVIFHDHVPMHYMCALIRKTSSTRATNLLLPHLAIENEVEPDMTKQPFYCYPLEKNYTGIDPLPESSRQFFEKMAQVCNVDDSQSTDEIIAEIKNKIPELHADRSKQQLQLFRSGGGKRAASTTFKKRKQRDGGGGTRHQSHFRKPF